MGDPIMIKKLGWLPEIVSVDGEWNEVLSRLYRIFEQDFKETERTFNRMKVWWDRRVAKGERYEEGFWHLITKDQTKSKDRLFDPRRAERLPWCGPTISHSSDDRAKVWDFKESNGRIRTYIWLGDWDYVVILQKRKHRKGMIAFLITAFYVDGDSTRRNVRLKFEKRESINAIAAPF
jgi:hypothetical protein